jgi:GNAT superfamily N-acetyltransferase
MQSQKQTKVEPVSIAVRPLRKSDLPEANRIFHLAFGTFLGLPDPMQFCPDRDYVCGRYCAYQEGALGAEAHGELVGSNFVTDWGSVGFFGPLTIRPDFWERGVAKRLLEPTMQLFERWQTRHAGLFTFSHSTKHVHLYQKFGFWPRFLTALMFSPVHPSKQPVNGALYSDLAANLQLECLKASRELTDAIFEGLDLQREICIVAEQNLGDTVFLWDGSHLAAFAVCHCGAGTEAGEGACYVKFGAARTAEAFKRLLEACEGLAQRRGLSRLEAGVNMARHKAYERMVAHGFQTRALGVAMHKPNEPGYNRPEVYLIDDWR